MRQFLKALPKLNLKYLTIFIVGTILVLLWAMPSIAADCKSLAAYQSEYKDCHACLSIKVMLEAFMTAASKTYDISREAGTILLKIGSFLWIAFFIIKKISSFTNPEAPKMVNEFLVFMFLYTLFVR